MSKHYRYLFGPVPSRRLGRSLGIDPICAKRCSFDCVFCEVGETDILTQERREYVPTAAVIDEFRDWLEQGGVADVITLAGAGEPTLHTRFGEIIDAIHAMCSIPVVLLTNSTLLWDADVRLAAARADVVKVSLSAWDDASLTMLNRPAAGVTFDRLLSGMHAFRLEYKGALWLEVVLVRGINDAPEQVARIAVLATSLKPDKVQLNTVVRPPAVGGSGPVSDEELLKLAMLFTPPAEVIALRNGSAGARRELDPHEDLLAMLARRPCTVADIADVFGLATDVSVALVASLMERGGIRCETVDGKCYYSA